MLAKFCSMSQGQPPSGSRKRRITSIRRGKPFGHVENRIFLAHVFPLRGSESAGRLGSRKAGEVQWHLKMQAAKWIARSAAKRRDWPMKTPLRVVSSFLRRRPLTKDLGGVDLAVSGIPFDQAVTNRPGARFGPRAIRAASTLMAGDAPYGWGYSPVGCVSLWWMRATWPSTMPARMRCRGGSKPMSRD